MAQINIGRVRIAWQGEWDSNTSYVALDAVSYQGSSYVARQDVPLGTPPTNTTYFQLMALAGSDGTDGTDGAPGPKGDQGIQGIQGPIPEHQWAGSDLRFQKADGTWGNSVNLLGPQGIQGEQGVPGATGPDGAQGPIGPEGPAGPQGIQGPQGLKGDQGVKGDTPDHEWGGTSLRFQNPDGTWSVWTNLKGDKGDKGDQGPAGPNNTDYMVLNPTFQSNDVEGALRYDPSLGPMVQTFGSEHTILTGGNTHGGYGIETSGGKGTGSTDTYISKVSYALFFTTSGTFYPPHGDFHPNSLVTIQVWGGGGGGELNSAGGGGGYTERFLRLRDLPTSVPIVVGAGGTGDPGGAGTDGGNTEFGIYAKAYGGTRATSNGYGGGGAGAFGQSPVNSNVGGRGGGGDGYRKTAPTTDEHASGGDAMHPWAGGGGAGQGDEGFNGEGGYAINGGGGGGVGTGNGGQSQNGGNGGNGGQAGSAPGGGGGNAANGGRGEVRIFIT